MLQYLDKKFKSTKRHYGGKFRRYTVVVNRRIYRPPSYPFISGDTFRKYSNFVFDETKSFNPKSVKQDDVVFLKSNLKEIYFSTIHPKIENKYILLTHNSDENITDNDKTFIDEKIIHWFAQNLNIIADKQISPLPIGFENRFYLNNGKIKILKIGEKNEQNKVDKIHSSFNLNTNYFARNEVLNKISTIEHIHNLKFSTPREYITNLKYFKFVICPEGNGKDTHRIWEALLTKTIPIVLKNEFTINLASLGVPLNLIDNWDELDKFTNEFINKEYKKYRQNEFLKFTKFKFWETKINEVKLLSK